MVDGETHLNWTEYGRTEVNQTVKRLSQNWIDYEFVHEGPSVVYLHLMEIVKVLLGNEELRDKSQQIRENPYAPESLETIMTLAEELSITDENLIRTAVIFAEPEGLFEQGFRVKCNAEREALAVKFAAEGEPPVQDIVSDYSTERRALRLNQQHEKVQRYENEIDQAADIGVRLIHNVREHLEEIDQIADEDLYHHLMQVAFEGKTEEQIEQLHSQHQRRSIRLAISHLIEDRRIINQRLAELPSDPTTLTQQLLEIKVERIASVKRLPVGLVIYLEQVDYLKFTGEKNITSSSNGQTLFWNSLGKLSGHVIVINLGDIESAMYIQQTEDHELNHLITSQFFLERNDLIAVTELEESFNKITSWEDHIQFAAWLCESLAILGKDETISYAFGSKMLDFIDVKALGGGKWKQYFETIRDCLWKNENISVEQKQRIYGIYRDAYQRYIGRMKKYFDAVFNLQEAGKQHFNGLSEDKAHVLLMQTPIEKVSRLDRQCLDKHDETNSTGEFTAFLLKAHRNIHRHLLTTDIKAEKKLLAIPNFVNNIPLDTKVARLFHTDEERMNPSLDQIKQLIALLPARDSSSWLKYFNYSLFDPIRQSPEAISCLLMIAEKADVFAMATAISYIEGALRDRKSEGLRKDGKDIIARLEHCIRQQPDQSSAEVRDAKEYLEKNRQNTAK